MTHKKNIQEEIAKVAYDLFENGGRMYGCELENWLAAEKIVMEKHAGKIEQDGNLVSPTKKKKASSKAEPKTLKTSEKTSAGSSHAKTKKSPPKKKIG